MPSTPAQRARIDRVETLIGVMAPALNLVLAAGDRLSRLVGRDEPVYPLRPPGQAFELERLARESRERLAAQRAERERIASGQADEHVGAQLAADSGSDPEPGVREPEPGPVSEPEPVEEGELSPGAE